MREELLKHVRKVLAGVRLRNAYHPGARELYQRFLDAHPEAEKYDSLREGELPWTIITNIDPKNRDAICFKTESFCPVIAELAIDGQMVCEYIIVETTGYNNKRP
jgi:hypothetical protein